MKKKTIGIIAAVVLVVAAVVYVAVRLNSRGTDLTGVTTLTERNTVIMNSKEANSFVSGSGQISVGERGQIHINYALSSGSCDIAFHAGSTSLDVFQDAELDQLPDAGEGLERARLPDTGEIFGVSGVSGTGSLDLAAESGDYTVWFSMHGAVGTATITAPER